MPPPKAQKPDPEKTVADATAAVSSAGDDLEDVLRQAEADVANVFVRRHNELRPALDALDAAKTSLLAVVDSHPAVFAQPRSRTVAGVRVQVRKGSDKWQFDPDVTAALIAEHRPDLQSAVTTRTVIDRKKLEGLSQAQLKKLGITRTAAEDTTTIKRLRDDLDERLERVRPWL